MLSLSEVTVSEGETGNIQGWVKERDDLLTTVESLKGLITHTQIKVGVKGRLCVLILCISVYLSARCAPADIRQRGLASAAAGCGATSVSE